MRIDGRSFASRKEAARYLALRQMERGGEIRDLRCQVPFPIRVNGSWVCDYVADFVYRDRDGKVRVEDVKGYRGGEAYRLFRLKRDLLLATVGVRVEEV